LVHTHAPQVHLDARGPGRGAGPAAGPAGSGPLAAPDAADRRAPRLLERLQILRRNLEPQRARLDDRAAGPDLEHLALRARRTHPHPIARADRTRAPPLPSSARPGRHALLPCALSLGRPLHAGPGFPRRLRQVRALLRRSPELAHRALDLRPRLQQQLARIFARPLSVRRLRRRQLLLPRLPVAPPPRAAPRPRRRRPPPRRRGAGGGLPRWGPEPPPLARPPLQPREGLLEPRLVVVAVAVGAVEDGTGKPETARDRQAVA